MRVAFLGFAPYSFDGQPARHPGARRRSCGGPARQAALVVVIIHAGAEGAEQLHTPYGTQFFLGEDRGNARAFAHAVINAGASIVVGSGPHVIRGIERYRGRLIAYSLGNFVGYHTLGGGGVLSRQRRSSASRSAPAVGVLAGRWISVRLVGGLPAPEPSNASAPTWWPPLGRGLPLRPRLDPLQRLLPP